MFDKTFTAGEVAAMHGMDGPYILRTWKKRKIFQSEFQSEPEGGWTRYTFSEALEAGCLWQMSKVFGSQLSAITPYSSTLRDICRRSDLLTEDRFSVLLGNGIGVGVLRRLVDSTAAEIPSLLSPPPDEGIVTCSMVVNVSAIAKAMLAWIEPPERSDAKIDGMLVETEAFYAANIVGANRRRSSRRAAFSRRVRSGASLSDAGR